MFELACRDKRLQIKDMPLVMGILNVTPDSFSDGGKYVMTDKALFHAEEMIRSGASIIDIGGESTRPGAEYVNEDEEMARVIPIVERISREFDVVISVDTYKSSTAEESLKAGCHIINDVYGFLKDPKMAEVVRRYDAGCVLMSNALLRTSDEDIMDYTDSYLKRSLDVAKTHDISKDRILLDPGVGFGTTREEDLRLLREFDYGDNCLIGVSRKRIVAHLLNRETQAFERAFGSVGLALFAASKGAAVVRVHDVRETYDALLTYTSAERGIV